MVFHEYQCSFFIKFVKSCKYAIFHNHDSVFRNVLLCCAIAYLEHEAKATLEHIDLDWKIADLKNK